MKRTQRMKRSRDFRRLREHGKSKAGKYLVLSCLTDTEAAPDGFLGGFITSRKVGIAVVRNRVRRRLRSIVDEFSDRIVPGSLFVTIARYRAAQAPYSVLSQEWLKLAEKSNILTKEPLS